MSETVQQGELIKVSFEVRVPKSATVREVEEWVRFSCGDTGSCSTKNPLLNDAVEPWGMSFDLEFTGYIGRRIEGPHEKTENGGERYNVSYKRERIP